MYVLAWVIVFNVNKDGECVMMTLSLCLRGRLFEEIWIE